MQLKQTLSAAGVVALMAGAFSATPATAQAETFIKVDGSSTVFPITEAVAEEFQKAKKNVVKVTVGISGTGGGFKKFCRGETDISDASRPILKKEMDDCKKAGVEYYELPVAYDALTVMVNPMYTATAPKVTAAKRQSNLPSSTAATRANSRMTGMIENSR